MDDSSFEDESDVESFDDEFGFEIEIWFKTAKHFKLVLDCKP
jgi:hypothetical protein